MGIANTGGGDLTTYAAEIQKYNGISLEQTQNLKYAGYPVASFAFWIIGQTGNPHLIQALNGFVEYSILSYLLLDYCKTNHVPDKKIVICILLMLAFIPLYSSIAAIRSTPALALGTLALYRDVYKKERGILTIAFYLLPFFIHAAGLSMIAVRAIAFIFKKQLFLIFIVGLSALPVLIVCGNALTWVFASYEVNPMEMLLQYTGSSSVGWAATVSDSLFYQLFRILNIAFIVFIVFDIMVSEYFKMSRSGSKTHQGSFELLGVLLAGLGLVMSFCIFMVDPSFMRYSYAIYPFVVLYIAWQNSLSRSNAKEVFIRKVQSMPYRRVVEFKITNTIYALFALAFFVSHVYLASLGMDFHAFGMTLLSGIFIPSWLMGTV